MSQRTQRAERARRARRRRSRGAAAVEYVIVLIFIAIGGIKLVHDFGRTVRCKMTEAPGHQGQCAGNGDVRLNTMDDGCIGLVCKH